jgi:5-bromo-4-chloroindolyl phosphate hydrolysis protein
VLFLFFKNFFFWILGIAGALIAIFIIMLISSSYKEKKKKENASVQGLKADDIDSYISNCKDKLQQIRRNYYKIDDLKMREELDTISDLCRKIFKIVKEDPQDLKMAKRFLNTMLPSLERIINHAVLLFEAPSLDESGKKALSDALESVQLLRRATQSQINKLFENNILDLDVELEVLKKSLYSRGILKEDEINMDKNQDKDENKE